MKTKSWALVATALALTGCNKSATPPDIVTGNTMDAPLSPAVAVPDSMAAAPSTPDFISRVAISDMYEIEASKLALKSAGNPDIRKFAQQMVSDHTATTAKVKAIIAKDKLDPRPAALDADHQKLIDDLKAADTKTFDEVYTDQQRKAHEAALDLLQGYGAAGENADLKAFANDIVPKVQGHLDMIKALDKIGADEPKG